MSGAALQALGVHLALGVGLVVVMLTISFRRGHGLAAWLTVLVFLAALGAMWPAALVAPQSVTPLLAIDGFALYFCGLFVAAALVTAVLARQYLEGGEDDPEEFYLLLLAATLGAATLAGASHFASLLLGLEILSVALYVLIAYPQAGHPPLEAALKYLILSGAASTTMLFGMALMYAGSGTMEFSSLSAAGSEPYTAMGLVMVLAGVGFKLSLVPFHMWTPDVYQGAPAPVAGYLATVAKGAMLAVLVRFLADSGALESPVTQSVLAVLAVLSMIIGNLLALLQGHLKRVLAYSAIAHFGYLLIPLVALGAVDEALAVEATLVYLAAYLLMNLAAFTVITLASGRQVDGDADAIEVYTGLFWHRPGLALALTLALLSLAGIPLTAGFIGKFYLFAAGITAMAWALLGALVVGSGIGLYYYLRVVFVMTRRPTEGEAASVVSAPAAQWTLGVLGVLVVLVGVYPMPLIEAVRQALESWHG